MWLCRATQRTHTVHLASAELLLHHYIVAYCISRITLHGYCIIVASQFSAFKLHLKSAELMLRHNNWGCVLPAISRKVFNWQGFKVNQDARQGSNILCAKNWAKIPGGLAAYSPHTYIHTYKHTYKHTDRSPASSPFRFFSLFIRTLTSGKPQCGNIFILSMVLTLIVTS